MRQEKIQVRLSMEDPSVLDSLDLFDAGFHFRRLQGYFGKHIHLIPVLPFKNLQLEVTALFRGWRVRLVKCANCCGSYALTQRNHEALHVCGAVAEWDTVATENRIRERERSSEQ